jgi:hypothetical protein
MPGKSFQSKLEPHFDLILEARRDRQTWIAIVELLAAQGVTTTKQALHAFIKRRLKRRYPLGASPAMAADFTQTNPSQESKLTKLPPSPSEFGPDPLTLPLKGKSNSGWGVLKPKT